MVTKQRRGKHGKTEKRNTRPFVQLEKGSGNHQRKAEDRKGDRNPDHEARPEE